VFMEVRLGRNKVISLSFVVLPVSPQFVDSMGIVPSISSGRRSGIRFHFSLATLIFKFTSYYLLRPSIPYIYFSLLPILLFVV